MHPSPTDLQALADEESLGARGDAILIHVQSCAACQRTVSELHVAHARDAEMFRVLDRVFPPADVNAVIARGVARRRRHTAGAAIAAGIGVMAIAAVAAASPASPLHGFVARLVAGATALVSPAAPPVTTTTGASHRASEAGVSFPPGAGVEIAFEPSRFDTQIRLVLVNAPMVRVTSRGVLAAYELTAHGVTVRNASSDAEYEIALPTAVARAVVRVGSHTVFSKSGSHINSSGTVDSSGAYLITVARTP